MWELVLGYTAMWLLGYWAAHIRLTGQRNKVLMILTEARDILAHLESDRSKVGGTDGKGLEEAGK